ncbi:hypothetical protein AMTRI_Chr11g97420 [Amborella trichopoda]
MHQSKVHVIPLFYDVKPSEVRRSEKGVFKLALTVLRNLYKKKSGSYFFIRQLRRILTGAYISKFPDDYFKMDENYCISIQLRSKHRIGIEDGTFCFIF